MVVFPQPLGEEDQEIDEYFFVTPCGEVMSLTKPSITSLHWEAWLVRLIGGICYSTKHEAEQRKIWNEQETKRLVKPYWFRKLGPKVQFETSPGVWIPLPSGYTPVNWYTTTSERYRIAPQDVVVKLNGEEYRWPATAEKGDPEGDRYTVYENPVQIIKDIKSRGHGKTVHFTRAGASRQLDLFRALKKIRIEAGAYSG